jgi:hypothetical protein
MVYGRRVWIKDIDSLNEESEIWRRGSVKEHTERDERTSVSAGPIYPSPSFSTLTPPYSLNSLHTHLRVVDTFIEDKERGCSSLSRNHGASEAIISLRAYRQAVVPNSTYDWAARATRFLGSMLPHELIYSPARSQQPFDQTHHPVSLIPVHCALASLHPLSSLD